MSAEQIRPGDTVTITAAGVRRGIRGRVLSCSRPGVFLVWIPQRDELLELDAETLAAVIVTVSPARRTARSEQRNGCGTT